MTHWHLSLLQNSAVRLQTGLIKISLGTTKGQIALIPRWMKEIQLYKAAQVSNSHFRLWPERDFPWCKRSHTRLANVCSFPVWFHFHILRAQKANNNVIYNVRSSISQVWNHTWVFHTIFNKKRLKRSECNSITNSTTALYIILLYICCLKIQK